MAFIGAWVAVVLSSLNVGCSSALFSEELADEECRRLVRAVSAVYVALEARPPGDVGRPGPVFDDPKQVRYRISHALGAVRLGRAASALSRYFSDAFIPSLRRVLAAVKAGSASRWKCAHSAVERVERVERLPVRVPDSFWRSQVRSGDARRGVKQRSLRAATGARSRRALRPHGQILSARCPWD